MKELKFRAWHEGNNEFIYATLKDFWETGYRCCEAEYSNREIGIIPTQQKGIFVTEDYLKNHSAFFLNAEWEQYTGVRDIKGKEIYEGDIILLKNILESFIPKRCRNYNAEVYWCSGDASFRYHIKEIKQTFPMEHRGEIIGNIHEKPELLEQTKKNYITGK